MILIRSKTKSIIAAMLVFVLAIGTYTSVWAQSGKRKSFTGEEMFVGIVFGQGPVSELFPEIWPKNTLKETNSEEAKKWVALTVADMKQSSPAFFDEFEKAVYSKDYVAIDQAFTKGGTLLNEAINRQGLMYQNADDPTVNAFAAGVLVMVGAGVYNYAAVVHTAAAGIQVVAGFAYWVYNQVKFWPKAEMTASSQLEKELFVNKVIDRLSSYR